MININDLQEDIVQRLKANLALVAKLDSSKEIKEDQWKGRAFKYPAIRVNILPIVPTQNSDCVLWRAQFSVLCYSEKDSSMEANEIAGLVLVALHNLPFTGTNIKFTMINSRQLIPARSEDERTWRSEVIFNSLLQKI